jgi:Ni,Fe-hydrogenase maturation factor
MPDLHLIAVSIKDFQNMGMELTPEIEAAIPNVMKQVKELVEELQK